MMAEESAFEDRDRVENAAGLAGAADGDAIVGPFEAEGSSASADEAGSSAGSSDDSAAARALAENNALALAFDFVRSESREGRLVSPDKWVELGLVPDHLTDEDFEMLAYEYWEDDEARRKEEEAKKPAAPAPKFRTATRAVGIPPLIGRSAEDADESAAGKADEIEQSTPAAAGSAPAAQSVQPSPSAPARAKAADDDNPFAGLDIPAGFELVELEGEWCLVETGEVPEPVELEIDTEGIKALIGSHSYYLYDGGAMTDVYARWAYLAAEDDPQVTFAECVRQDSKVYPRPMPLESLRNAPFRMSVDEIESTWRAVRESGAYPDLERVEASNGDVYFYSTLYLTPVHAASLAEWDAVERYQNV